jgi:hypothetical protein
MTAPEGERLFAYRQGVRPYQIEIHCEPHSPRRPASPLGTQGSSVDLRADDLRDCHRARPHQCPGVGLAPGERDLRQ